MYTWEWMTWRRRYASTTRCSRRSRPWSGDDYAKWMLEDPRVNFAISKPSDGTGIGHLGIQVENRSELADVYSRLRRTDARVLEEGRTSCCYSISEKSWIADPQGIRWETFYTTGESEDHCSVVPGDSHAIGCCGAAEPAGRAGGAGSDPGASGRDRW